MRIEPTIGRIVWYWPQRTENGNLAEGVVVYTENQPFVATICHVDEGGQTINIAGFDHAGQPFASRAVELVQQGDAVPGRGRYCEWMPYQVGQAKKHAGEDMASKPMVVDQTSKPYATGFSDGYRQAEFDLDAMGLEAFKKYAETTAARDAELVHQRGYREGYSAGYVDGKLGRARRNIGLSFPVGGYDFSDAIRAAVDGARIYREGWNGRKAGLDQFVVYMSRLQLPAFNTQGTEKKVNDRTAKWIGADTPLDCQPYFAMHNGGGNWQPGWLASQADMLAQDWVIVPDVVDVAVEAPAA